MKIIPVSKYTGDEWKEKKIKPESSGSGQLDFTLLDGLKLWLLQSTNTLCSNGAYKTLKYMKRFSDMYLIARCLLVKYTQISLDCYHVIYQIKEFTTINISLKSEQSCHPDLRHPEAAKYPDIWHPSYKTKVSSTAPCIQ